MSAPPGTFRLPNGGLLALVTVHELLTLNARKAKDGGCFESIGAELKQRNSEYLAFAVLCKNLPTQDTPPWACWSKPSNCRSRHFDDASKSAKKSIPVKAEDSLFRPSRFSAKAAEQREFEPFPITIYVRKSDGSQPIQLCLHGQ